MTHTLSNGQEIHLIEVPEETFGYWLDLNHLYAKRKGGFELVYTAGEVFTEKQIAESLVMTSEILGTYHKGEIDFEVKNTFQKVKLHNLLSTADPDKKYVVLIKKK